MLSMNLMAAISTQKQDSNIPQTILMKLIIPKYLAVVASSIQFDGIDLLSNVQNGLQKLTLGSSSYQTSLQPAFICSKLTIVTLEQEVKYAQS